MLPLQYAALAGAGTHLVVKRREPTVVEFLSLLLMLHLAIFAQSYDAVGALVAIKDAVLTVSCFVAGLAASTITYRLSSWHPLAGYPGPLLAKLSKWYMAVWIGKGNRHLVLQQLHGQYGPWLRIGPNEISVNLSSAIRPVYSQMFRSSFYQGVPQDADALITTTSRAEHDSRLIAWNKAFSVESLRNFRMLAQARTDQLLEIMQREGVAGKAIDLSHWIALWSMDVMGDISFSGGFETMAAGRDTEGWMNVLQLGVLFVGILGQVPWLRDIIAMLPQPGPIITFHQFAGRKVRETKAPADGMKQDILGIIQDTTSGGPPLSPQQAAADAAFMVVAGSDTISQGSAALFRYIIENREVQTKLREEAEAAFDGQEIDALTLARLPYLDACVQEGLRIMPPVAAGPPRYTDKGVQILDRYIPPGTTVACPTYTLHRDPRNFVNPDQFIPERWLGAVKSRVQPHNMEAFVPFSYGLGVCIGKPVALHNMKFLVVKLLQSFELEFVDDFDVNKFDVSWKEHNLWLHDSLMVKMTSL